MAGPLPDGYRREHYGSLASTNAHALAAARAGAAGGLWVTTDEQTEGRGRRGRAWTNGAGNLAASLILVDPAPRALAPTVSFVAAVALHQAVVDLAGPAAAERLALKWPNDLLLDRAKVAGILIEGEGLASGAFAVVIGIGVNCVSHPEIARGQTAGDLTAHGLPVDAETLFGRLAARMDEELSLWDRGRGFAEVRTAWLARAAGVGEPIRVNLATGALTGRFEALDEDGRLVLLRDDGQRQNVGAGDVFLVGAR
jgi:BirA family transcriptional regulator, biotin operon repressor / biotin---[acetyl-CoA-carboxylase] ligase